MAQSALKAQLHDVHFSIALYQIACTKSEHTQIHTYTTHSHYHSNSLSLSLTHTHIHLNITPALTKLRAITSGFVSVS